MRVFNSIGFIGLVVFCAAVLTSIVFSAPAPVAPVPDDFSSEWTWLVPAAPVDTLAATPVRQAGLTAIR